MFVKKRRVSGTVQGCFLDPYVYFTLWRDGLSTDSVNTILVTIDFMLTPKHPTLFSLLFKTGSLSLRLDLY